MPSKPRKPLSSYPLIGWRERVRLPQLGTGLFIAKIDTGARSAALHAEHIALRGRMVHFKLTWAGRTHGYALPVKGMKRIKSTSGHSEQRWLVETDVEIGAHRYPAEITLTDRTDMGVPMLLGRLFLRGRFLVNPARSFLLSGNKRQNS